MTYQAVQPIEGTALCWGCIPHADLIQLAELARRGGFPEITVHPSQYSIVKSADSRVRERLDDLGVTVGVIDALMTYLPGSARLDEVPPHWRKLMVDLDECLEAAEALHARTLNVAHFLGDPTVKRNALASAVRQVADRAAEVGVRVSLEFIPGTGIPDLGAALDIVRRADHPGVGILFDTWHFLRSGGTPTQLAEVTHEQVFEVQISDRVQPGRHDPYVPMTGRLAPGEGTAPIAEIVRALGVVAPDVVLGVEVFTADIGDPDETLAHLSAATRMFLRSTEFGSPAGIVEPS
ncbi:sugar phosphate isomerase/epimerase family protein [Rhodococcus qingshengii]